MTLGTVTLPQGQLEPLQRAYAQARRKKRLQMILIGVALLLAVIASSIVAEVRPETFLAHADRLTSYLGRVFQLENRQPVWTDPREWFWGLGKWSKLIAESLLIAYLGTVIGCFFGFFLSFLSASNLVSSKITQQATRRLLEFCRTVPELVFALLFVASFGLGPLPGVLAIAIHTIGALGKQFSEVVENANMKPFEGVIASGGTWTEAVRFSILPQVTSNFASYGLLRFEINVREFAILGFVGAGGIGMDLLVAVRRFYYSDVSAIVLMIIVTVAIIDLVTERIRVHLLGREQPS